VDTDGLLLGILVHAADIQDADGLGDLLKRLKPLNIWLRAVFTDASIIGLRPCSPAIRVVERSLGWFGRWRRLSKDYEALPEVSEAMVTLAAIRLMLDRLAHLNRRRLPAA
jgi:putative transposase